MYFWSAIKEQIKELEDSDINLTHIQINYQVREVVKSKNTAVINVMLK